MSLVGFVVGRTLTLLNVRLGSISTELDLSDHVRFTLDSDRPADIAGGPVRANN
jgi:hypothetical protein